jgi:hypothetical protein
MFRELRILLQAPRDRCDRHCRAERMSDNQNFVDIGFADSVKNLACEIVDPLLHFRSPTMKQVPGKNSVIKGVIYSSRAEPVHQSCENHDRDENAGYRRPYTRQTRRPGCGISQSGAA